MTDKATATPTKSKVTALTLIGPVRISYLIESNIVKDIIDANRRTNACAANQAGRKWRRNVGQWAAASGTWSGTRLCHWGGIAGSAVHRGAISNWSGQTEPCWARVQLAITTPFSEPPHPFNGIICCVCATRQFWLIPAR